MPKVTIIIPAYNAESSIEKCANSALQQTLNDIEILFFDDGSTDKTGIILDSLIVGHTNARVIHQQNIGIFATRAKAIKAAKGEYVGWIDADDYADPDMFEILYDLAVKNDSDLAYCDYQYEPESVATKEKWFRKYEGKRDIHYVERNSQFWNKLVRKELLIDSKIPEMLPTCFEESMIKVLLKAKNPVWTERKLYHYTVLSGSMSSRYNNIDYYKGFIHASEQLAENVAADFHEEYWKDYFDFRVIYYYLMTMIVAANAGNKEEYKSLKRELKNKHPHYKNNEHYWAVLKDIYGQLKATVIGTVVPTSYKLTNILCWFQFRRRERTE